MSSFIAIDWRGRRVQLEYAWVNPGQSRAPVLVFLHEGLGSLTGWRDFPERLCRALGAKGLVFSRPGYGRSSEHPSDEALLPDFLHRQAYEVLPALLDALGLNQRFWLVGHGDGASIALLHASLYPDRVAGMTVISPHIFVEDITVAGIRRTRQEYASGVLRSSLLDHHKAPDAVFRVWTDIWLDPRFMRWNITDELSKIRCPMLAIQGLDDVYGSLAQIRGIAECQPTTQLLEMPLCGHYPHRDQPEHVLAAISHFIHNRRHA